MNKMIRFMQNYLIIGLPFVVVFLTLSSIHPNNQTINYVLTHYKIFWTIVGIGLMLWFMTLFLFLLCLIITPTIREKTLKRLANLNERDEREEYITGKASRSAYIFTLSLMIFLLFLSMFSMSLCKIPNDQSKVVKYQHRLSVDLHFYFFNKPKRNNPNEIIIFDTQDFMPSSSTIILILLGCQLLVFNLTARKENIINV